VVTTAAPAPFSAVRALRAAAWFGGLGLTLSAVKAATGWGIGCPWRALTGTRCPLCGATTMGAHLLTGDLPGAWAANPFVLILLGIGVVAVIAWVIEATGGPALRPPGRLRSAAVWWLGLGGAAVAYWIGRNL